MKDALRLFVALPLGAELVAQLQQLQQALRARMVSGAVRWVRPAQLHLTLRFLGDVGPERVEDLQRTLTLACQGTMVPDLRIEGLGAFPDRRQPRVVWAGVGGDLATLDALQAAVREACEAFVPTTEDRAYAAHLTLGRVNSRDPANVRSARAALADFRFTDRWEWVPEEVRLIRSELRPEGSVYTNLAVFPLSQGAAGEPVAETSA